MELNPFNHLVFGPPPSCLRLKTKVTYSPPRLATSEWLVLTRRESHPLYDTTYARPHTHPLLEEENLLPFSPVSLKIITVYNTEHTFLKVIGIRKLLKKN